MGGVSLGIIICHHSSFRPQTWLRVYAWFKDPSPRILLGRLRPSARYLPSEPEGFSPRARKAKGTRSEIVQALFKVMDLILTQDHHKN